MFTFGAYFTFVFIVLHHRYKHRINEYIKVKNYPTISIIVPAYNEEKSIINTLNALVKLNYPINKKQVIVVNDGSTDGTDRLVRTFISTHKNFKYLDKKNSGKADSLNQAIKLANGELIAVVDADSYPKSDSLIKMVGFFQDEKVAAVTSRVLVKNKDSWINKFDVMDYAIIAWSRKLLDFIDSVYVTNGPLSAYRKNVVLAVGGFDTKNLTEDIEITWNILSKGYHTRMSYDSIVYTTVPSNLSGWIKQRVRWNLGGLQTIHKYWRIMVEQPQNVLGSIIIPYVSLAFILAFIGILLIGRYLWIKGIYNLTSIYYVFQGYDYLKYFQLEFNITLILILSVIFSLLSIYFYKLGAKQGEAHDTSILKILIYSFVFRSLYLIPLIMAIYKLARGDIRWYTK
jgi:cellulose synthase/poly-beta-1,6-N-acetylglucosamine synthase-like glycosyltransferase